MFTRAFTWWSLARKMNEPGKFVLLKNVQASSKKIKKHKPKNDTQLKKKLRLQLKKNPVQVKKQGTKTLQVGDGTKKKKNKQNRKQELSGKKNSHEIILNNAKNKKQKHQVAETSEEPKNFHDDLAGRLKASRFRFINEQLYTQTGDEAIKVFKEDESAFSTYHDGYRIQVKQWPINPLDRIIKSIKKL